VRILVTGSDGAVGRPLVRELEARDHLVYGVDLRQSGSHFRADVGDFREIQRVVQTLEPELVYHLAAEFGRHNGESHYERVWRTNAVGTRHMLELQRVHKFRMVHASTSEIYGDLPEAVLPLHEDTPIGPLWNDYALSKWVNEQQIHNFSAKSGNQVVRVRIFNAYGPEEYYHPFRSVVCLFVHNALHDLPLEVFDGMTRDFLYIDDLVPTMANITESFYPGRVYNLAGDDHCSIMDLAAVVLQSVGTTKSECVVRETEQFNVVSKRADISRARHDLRHDPKVKLEEGVPKTIDWMRSL
jgi:dTDP-glucose 4,6-dehydratase